VGGLGNCFPTYGLLGNSGDKKRAEAIRPWPDSKVAAQNYLQEMPQPPNFAIAFVIRPIPGPSAFSTNLVYKLREEILANM